ncbi:MAG: hypothetical protein MHM6MM_001750 [Cercozoa sp. M6MM]
MSSTSSSEVSVDENSSPTASCVSSQSTSIPMTNEKYRELYVRADEHDSRFEFEQAHQVLHEARQEDASLLLCKEFVLRYVRGKVRIWDLYANDSAEHKALVLEARDLMEPLIQEIEELQKRGQLEAVEHAEHTDPNADETALSWVRFTYVLGCVVMGQAIDLVGSTEQLSLAAMTHRLGKAAIRSSPGHPLPLYVMSVWTYGVSQLFWPIRKLVMSMCKGDVVLGFEKALEWSHAAADASVEDGDEANSENTSVIVMNLVVRGKILYKLGRKADARELWQQVVELDERMMRSGLDRKARDEARSMLSGGKVK